MFVALILWSCLALVGWWALLRRTHWSEGLVATDAWRTGDAISAGALAMMLVFVNILGGDGKAHPVTLDGIKMGIAFYAFLVTILIATLVGRHIPVRQIFGLAPKRPLLVLAAGIACIAMTYPLVEFLSQLAERLGHSASGGDEMVQFFQGKLSGSDKAWAIALVVIVAPITEELIFRGYFYGILKKYAGRLAAMATAALLFAAIHDNIPAIPALFTLAVGLTLAYEFTGSLWTPIVMHMIFNSATVVIILFFPEWISKP